MSCTSAIYAANSNEQEIPAGLATAIDFGRVIRAFGSNVKMYAGNVKIDCAGDYIVETNFAFTAGAGAVAIQLYEDGVAIPGAVRRLTAAAGGEYSRTIPFLIRSTCCKEKVITAEITSAADATITNAAILIHRVR